MSNEIKLNVSKSRGYENAKVIVVENKNGVAVVSSRVVARDFDKQHNHVLRDIDNIKSTNTIQDWTLLFIESQYKASNGKMNKEYLLTRDGFSLLVMGFTGKEALQWKLQYIEAFNQMEERIKQQAKLPQSPMEVMELMFHALKDTNKEIEEVKADLQDHKVNSPLYNVECDELQNAVKKKAVGLLGGKQSNAYKDKSIRQQVFGDLQKQIKREFRVESYKAIKRCQLDKAKEIVEDYKLPYMLEQDIYWINNQMSLM